MNKKLKFMTSAIGIAVTMMPVNTVVKASEISNAEKVEVDTKQYLSDDVEAMYDTIAKYTPTWERDPETGKYTYPITSESDIWASLNHAEKVALCDIPEYVLADITDKELVELVLDYPFLIDVYAYNSFEDGMEEVAKYFPALNTVLRNNLLTEYAQEKMAYEPNELSLSESNDVFSTKTSFYSDDWATPTTTSSHDGIENLFISDYLREVENSAPDMQTMNAARARVSVRTPKGSNVYFVQYGEQYNATQKKNIRDEVESQYPNCTYLAAATTNYNCHSYAWYSQSIATNTVWIPDPSVYMTDGSYKKVGTSPTANYQKVYYDYGSDAHSGIVTNYSTRQITSKWGALPLMSHNVYDCPYFRIPMNTDKIVYYK